MEHHHEVKMSTYTTHGGPTPESMTSGAAWTQRDSGMWTQNGAAIPIAGREATEVNRAVRNHAETTTEDDITLMMIEVVMNGVDITVRRLMNRDIAAVETIHHQMTAVVTTHPHVWYCCLY